MDVFKSIKERRSVRKFKKKIISKRIIDKILEAGKWAPSGLNNQPWKFMVLEKDQKDTLADYTHYSHILKSADKAIAIFLDKKTSYNYEKDLMAIGACTQNMLLYIHSQGLGACWLGEILNQRTQIQKVLKVPKNLELEVVLVLGYPAAKPKSSRRKSLKDLIIT